MIRQVYQALIRGQAQGGAQPCPRPARRAHPRTRSLGVRLLLLVCTALAAAAPAAQAQSAENVAVVINEASPASQQIGEYYASRRGLPPRNILHIRTTVEERITREQYASTVENPIGAALKKAGAQDRILFLVLTKGVPLRIEGTAGVQGTLASVDSELSLLYRRMTGRSTPIGGRVPNPYFIGSRPVADARPFSHHEHDILLVTRLDAFTVKEVLMLIDRGSVPAPAGQFVLDQRSHPTAATGDGWMTAAAKALTALGQGTAVTLEDSPLQVKDVPPAIGYYSWSTNDPALRSRRTGLTFLPGALAATLSGGDTRTFEPPPDTWTPGDSRTSRMAWWAGSAQALAGDLIREGVTGLAGNIADPLLRSAVRPDILFAAYASGFTLAESVYLALPDLSWQSVVIGDPLCRPFSPSTRAGTYADAPLDPETGLPALFSVRRLQVLEGERKGAPRRALILMARAEARLSQGDIPEARRALEQAVELDPDYIAAHLQLGILDEQAADTAAAIARYRRILAIEPRNLIALNNLAYRLAVEQRDYDGALRYARKAAAIAPTEVNVLDTVGWIEYLRGNKTEAAKIFTTLAGRGVTNPEIRLHAAVVFASIGETSAARNQLAEAVRMDPSIEMRPDVSALRQQLSTAKVVK